MWRCNLEFFGVFFVRLDIIVRSPGYYTYTDTIIAPSQDYTTFNMPMVLIGSGVQVISHAYGQKRAITNVTLPDSSGFGFKHFGRTYHMVNFSVGTTPRAQLTRDGQSTRLDFAQEGTYRFFQMMSAADLRAGLTFNNLTSKISIFAGNDAETGHLATYRALRTPDTVWYLGDVIVTNPSPGCSRYSWQIVDTYGDSLLLEREQDNGAGTFLTENCVPLPSTPEECDAYIYDDSVETVVCGSFGDPHISTFDRTNETCGFDPLFTLVDNEYFSLVAETNVLIEGGASNVTHIQAIRMTYKHACNPATLMWNVLTVPLNFGTLSCTSLPLHGAPHPHQSHLDLAHDRPFRLRLLLLLKLAIPLLSTPLPPSSFHSSFLPYLASL